MANQALNKNEPVAYDAKNKSMPYEDSMERFSHDAGRKIGEMASDFTHKTSEYAKAGREYVKEHPTTGVAIAAAAGLVAGSLLTMALQSRKH